MTSMFVRILGVGALITCSMAVAQTGSAALPSAPSSAANAAATPPVATGDKVAAINIEGAIYSCNEGLRDFEALGKKLEPKQDQLKGANDEIEKLKAQLSSQSSTLTDAARGALVKQIETKQKAFEREMQDARDDAQGQQNEIAQRILGKMAPVMVKYAADNGFGMLIDTSKQWPDGQVVWAGKTTDITQPVIEAYNVQSGVPAPATPRPAAKPAAPASKPAPPSGVTPK